MVCMINPIRDEDIRSAPYILHLEAEIDLFCCCEVKT